MVLALRLDKAIGASMATRRAETIVILKVLLLALFMASDPVFTN